jgi:dCTP deaminase
MILSDKQILSLCNKQDMINPFFSTSVSRNEDGNKVTSFGLSSYGYDIRLGRNFIFFRGEENKLINYSRKGVLGSFIIEARSNTVIDPNNFDESLVVQLDDVDYVIVPPKTFFLGVSAEYMRIPRNVKVICDSKSTNARSGLVFFVTPLEPEWEGYITLEFFNSTDSLMKLTPGMGISQLSFMGSSDICETSYADRKGKYNHQGNQPIPPMQMRDNEVVVKTSEPIES